MRGNNPEKNAQNSSHLHQRRHVTQSDLSDNPAISPDVCKYCSRITAFLASRIAAGNHLQCPAERQLQHIDIFIFNAAAASLKLLGDKVDNFGHPRRRHIQLEQLMRIAHFVPGLFDSLFADAGFRLVVIQQPGAGFVSIPSSLPLTRVATMKLADQYDGLLITAVIQQHRGAVAAIVKPRAYDGPRCRRYASAQVILRKIK